jgi:septal ring-binding cell division protein DamX
MKKITLLLFVILLATKTLAVEPSSLPGGPVATDRQMPSDQLGYKSEAVTGIDLTELYTVQLVEFSLERDAQKWIKENVFATDDIAIAYILDNGTASYIVATGVHRGLINASNAADNFCHQNKLQGCWARNLARLETMAAAAEKAKNIIQEISP